MVLSQHPPGSQGHLCRNNLVPPLGNLSPLISAIIGLIGVLVGAWLTGRLQVARLRHEFVSRQLREFYSPLLGCRLEIRRLSEVRERIRTVTDATWADLLARATAAGPRAVEELTQNRQGEFDRDIEYNNRQLRERLLPAYREMVRVFRENMMLAEAETRLHFASLVEYMEIWDRDTAGTLPAEVKQRLGHTEEILHHFYDHLQVTYDRLRSNLASGGATPMMEAGNVKNLAHFVRVKWIVLTLLVLLSAYFASSFAGGLAHLNFARWITLTLLGTGQAIIIMFLWYRLGRVGWYVVGFWYALQLAGRVILGL